jgi:hypothetical protein
VCVVNIFMGKRACVCGCTECLCCEYCYGERKLEFSVIMNMFVLNNLLGKGK